MIAVPLAALLATASFAASPPRATVRAEAAAAARAQTAERVVYDGRYVRIPYPGGDVPAGTGVCTDVVIRAFRKAGVDLQKLVHEDMAKDFGAYPKAWGRRSPDANIDHRRVPNLMTFLARMGASRPRTTRAADYEEGDLVTWDLGGGVTHIGIVVLEGGRPWIVHNIGAGPRLEDRLFAWTVTGHYRWEPVR